MRGKALLPPKNHAHGGGEKDVRKPSPQITIDDFIQPFSGKLSFENRWVQLAKIIPWDDIEENMRYTDRETVHQMIENPYLQYFIGLSEYQLTKPFTAVALVKFRKRFNVKRQAKINERIISAEAAQKAIQSEEEKAHDEGHHDDD